MWKIKLDELNKLGITQTYIAAQIGVSQAFISQLASGKAKSLDYDAGVRFNRLYLRIMRKSKNETN